MENETVNSKKKSKKKGIIIVVCIVVAPLLLACCIGGVGYTIMAPQYMKYVEKSKAATDESKVREVGNVLVTILSDPAMNDYFGEGDIVDVVIDKAGVYQVSAESSEGEQKVYDELYSRLGYQSLEFKSKKMTGNGIALEVEYSSQTGAMEYKYVDPSSITTD